MSLTQPTISDHIRSLEAELGCRLFDRLGRSIAPTREADALFSHAVELIEKADAVMTIIDQVKSNPSGELVIGASTIPGSYMLPFLMASYKHKYPDVVFQIIIGDSKEIIGKLLSHELLLGIVGTLIPDEKLSYTHIAEDELILISSPNFMKGNSITLQELTNVPFVIREEGSGTRMEIERILMPHGIDINSLKIVGVFGTTTGVKQAVKSGMGISIVSRFAARDHLKTNALKQIKIPELTMKRNFYVVTHKKRSLPTAFSLFVEHIVPEIKKLLKAHS